MTRTLTALAIPLMTALAIGGCSKSSPVAPDAVAATQESLLNGEIAIGGDGFRDLSIQRGGTLTATLRWTTSNDLDLVVTDASCGTKDFYGCAILAAAKTRTPGGGSGVETVTAAVRAGQTLRFWIDNMDDAASAPYTLDVVVR